MSHRRPSLLAALLLLAPAVARGAGFQIGEEGAAATAMVGAFTAKADDPSAIFYNPAGIAQQRGLHAYVGLLLIIGQPSSTGSAALAAPSVTGSPEIAPVPNVYLAYGLPHDVAVGIGLFSNFGLAIDWPDAWAGRFLTTHASLRTITINPTVAWRPVRWLSIGAGVDFVPASVSLTRAENLVDAEGTARFTGNDFAVGGNVGVLFEGPILEHRELPLFAIGVHYRSRYDLDFDGGALTVKAPIELTPVLHDSRASAHLPIPDLLSFGAGVRPIDRLFIQLQVDWTRWQRFQSLDLVVRDNPTLSVSIPESWSDSVTLRFGAELSVKKVRPRIGFGYDWTPVPAATLGPTIPDSNRWLVSGGLGADIGKHLVLDGAVMGVIFTSRTSALEAFPVQYSNFAVLLSVGLSYRP